MTPRELANGGRHWREALGAAGDELREKNEEIEIYKERLKEIEIAFRYNLGLLSDRDTELDALEEHLRSGIAQLERLSQEKAVCEELLERLGREKRNEIKILKSELLSREKLLRDLKRESEGYASALNDKLENIQCEMHAKFEKEKMKLENKYLTVLELIKGEHAREMNALARKYAKQMDEMKKNKGELESALAENKLLKKYLAHFGRAKIDRKEKCCVGKCEEFNRIYRKMKEDMEKIVSGMEKPTRADKETMTSIEKRESFAQTVAAEEDKRDYGAIVEQNEVLKEIIKNLKRAKVEEESEAGKKFEIEMRNLKEELEMEKLKRSEEEAIIYNLEASVVCLKEKLMSALRRNLSDGSEKSTRAPEESSTTIRGKSARRKKISR